MKKKIETRRFSKFGSSDITVEWYVTGQTNAHLYKSETDIKGS